MHVRWILRSACRVFLSKSSRPQISLFASLVLGICELACCFAVNTTSQAQELWVYAQTNLLVPQEVERMDTLLQRAHKAGYTHLLVADSKFSRLSQLDKRYFDQVEQIKRRAAELGIKLVPAVCSVGYSNDILSLNPNLAEGLPVRESLYQVRSGVANHIPELMTELPALSDRRKWGFIDESLKLEDDHLRSAPPHSQNVRISKKIKLLPFRQYHASVWVKTDGFDTPVEIKVLSKEGRSLSYTNLGVQPTQDWKEHHVTFNSLENEEANLYIGAWGPTRGELRLKQPRLEECGAINLVRRDSAPISVQLEKEDGGRVPLVEGSDFEPWSDPKLGVIPYAGEYEVWHDSPPIRLVKKIPDGSKLRVAYFHTHVVYDGQVSGTASDREFQKLLDEQIARMTRLFPEGDFMMSHDEYRVMGWTEPNIIGLSKDASPGDVLTHNAKHCSEELGRLAPRSKIAVWSDMFDPFHNAVDRYYLVHGSLRGAKAPNSVRIVNWNFDKREESLKHFEGLGHEQILAGYYDANPSQIQRWLDTVVQQKLSKVQGVMYTTWRRDYSKLEEFADLVKSHPWYDQSR